MTPAQQQDLRDALRMARYWASYDTSVAYVVRCRMATELDHPDGPCWCGGYEAWRGKCRPPSREAETARRAHDGWHERDRLAFSVFPAPVLRVKIPG